MTRRRTARVRRRRSRVALALTTVAVAGAGAALGGELPPQVSSNWAGWVVTAGGAARRGSTATSRTSPRPGRSRRRPAPPARRTFAAFWVGLGGYAAHSQGARADRHRGRLQLARAALLLRLVRVRAAAAGDDPRAAGSRPATPSPRACTSAPTRSRVQLIDNDDAARRRSGPTHVMRSPTPDTSAAEWIAEAPSNCVGNNRCTPLRLTDFGQVTFSAASASSIGSRRHATPGRSATRPGAATA